MEFIIFGTSGTLLFTRSDAEEAHWIQHELQLQIVFPYIAEKAITRGMRIAFRDPVSDAWQVFEVRTIRNTEPEHFQQIAAESIAVAELNDRHINNEEITDKTPQQVLTTVLSGTGWSVGSVSASNTSSCNIARGNVWQAINVIEKNWNVYCIPRVAVSATGITNKYIDVIPAGGTFRGVRLSIKKNMSDSVVTYDDSDVLTALYGYGGSVDVPQSSGDDKSEELTFEDVVWTATAAHPAKPAGQKYLDYPEKTALYGRNGVPRFGYYQNGDITSATLLLEKTWEQLQECCEPKISISGTASELYRLGYKDQPMALHDIAIVEIEETGELFHREIIALDVDLLDATNTRPEIGDYIANIIYISRETEEEATGGRGGGGGGRGQSNSEYKEVKTFAEFEKTDSLIGMVVGIKDGQEYIKAGEIALSINETDGTSTALINADHVNISATNDVHTLAGDIEHDADGNLIIKNAGGLYVRRTESGITSQFGVWDNGNLTGGVMVEKINGTTEATIRADKINISATNDVHTLAGDIEHDANGNLIFKNAGGMYVQRTEGGITSQFGVWDNGNLTGGVMVQKINGTTETTIRADKINIDGIVTALAARHVGVGSLNVEGATEFNGTVYCEAGLASEEKVRSNTGFDPGTNTVHTEHSLKINGVEQAKFLGTADVNFTRAAAVVTLDDSGWIINDASTGDYTRTFTPKKDGVAVASAVTTISAQTIWNLGWNACRSWVLNNSHNVVEGATSWNSSDNATALYVAPQSGAAKATGQNQVWRYGGSKKTYYSAPSAK